MMQVEVEDDLTSSLQAMFIISSIAFLLLLLFFFEDRGSRVSVEFGEGVEISHHPNAASRRETSNFAPLCHNQCLATKDFLGLERELIGQTVALPRLLGAPASTTGQRRTLLKANGLSANTRYPLQRSVGKNTTQAINGTVSAPPNSQEHEREQLEDGQVPQALQQEARRLNTEHAQNLQGTWSHPPCKSATKAKGTTKKNLPLFVNSGHKLRLKAAALAD